MSWIPGISRSPPAGHWPWLSVRVSLLTALNLRIVLLTRQVQGQPEHMPSVPGSFWLSHPGQPHSWQAALPGTRLHLHHDYHVGIIFSERRHQEDRRVAKWQAWIWLSSPVSGWELNRAPTGRARAWSRHEESPFLPALEAAWYPWGVCPFWNFFLVIQYTELSSILINELWLTEQVCSECLHTKRKKSSNYSQLSKIILDLVVSYDWLEINENIGYLPSSSSSNRQVQPSPSWEAASTTFRWAK